MALKETWEKTEMYILSLWFLFFLMIVVTAQIPVCLGHECSFIGFPKLLSENLVPLVSSVFVIAGVIFYFRFDYKIAGSKSLPVKIEAIEDMNYEHLTFLTTYIIPLICFDLGSVRYVLAMAILLVVIGIIYVKTDKFFANPTLAVLGFHIYLVELTLRSGEKKKVAIIAKEKLAAGDLIAYQRLDEKVFFARKTA